MAKIIAFFGGLVVLGWLAIWGITSFLGIDDIKDCIGPNPLVAKCAPADAIVAISGGDTPARTQEAVKLYKAGWAPQIVFSGAALDPNSPSNAAAMRTQAITAGVPRSDIVLDEKAVDTEQNAIRTLALLANAKRIILVTSPYHQHRASLEFKHVFGDNVQIVNHPTQSDYLWPQNWWLTTTGWWLALSETVKTLVVML